MAEPSRPDSRYRKPVHLRVELVRADGEDAMILTALDALSDRLIHRLERMEKKIDALAKGAFDQQAIDHGAEEEPPAG